MILTAMTLTLGLIYAGKQVFFCSQLLINISNIFAQIYYCN